MRYEIPVTSSIFPETFDVEEIAFDFSGWRDEVGKDIVKRVKSFPSQVNFKQKLVWEQVEKLKNLNVDEIKYDSKKSEIEWLKISE